MSLMGLMWPQGQSLPIPVLLALHNMFSEIVTQETVSDCLRWKKAEINWLLAHWMHRRTSSQSAADAVDAERAAASPAYLSTCSGSELFFRRWRESARSRKKNQTGLFSLSPFLPADSKKKKGFGSSRDPNQVRRTRA